MYKCIKLPQTIELLTTSNSLLRVWIYVIQVHTYIELKHELYWNNMTTNWLIKQASNKMNHICERYLNLLINYKLNTV